MLSFVVVRLQLINVNTCKHSFYFSIFSALLKLCNLPLCCELFHRTHSYTVCTFQKPIPVSFQLSEATRFDFQSFYEPASLSPHHANKQPHSLNGRKSSPICFRLSVESGLFAFTVHQPCDPPCLTSSTPVKCVSWSVTVHLPPAPFSFFFFFFFARCFSDYLRYALLS